MSDNQHLYAALKKTLVHIQQRKARSEVWDEHGGGGGGGGRGEGKRDSGKRDSGRGGMGLGSPVASTVRSKESRVGLLN